MRLPLVFTWPFGLPLLPEACGFADQVGFADKLPAGLGVLAALLLSGGQVGWDAASAP